MKGILRVLRSLPTLIAIPTMARHAEKEANPLYPVPKLMTAKELEGFYYKIADWSRA